MNKHRGIVLYGDQSTGSGGACYVQALLRLGFDVHGVSDWADLEQYMKLSFAKIYRRAFHRLRERDRLRHVALLQNVVDERNPGLVVVLKGLHLAPSDVRKLRGSDRVVVNINHDDFFSRYPLNWSRIQRAAIPEYDAILTTREVNVEEIRPINPNVEFFPFAYEPSIHRPVPIPPEETALWNADVAFVGTYAPLRTALLEHLVTNVPARYAIWGSGWHHLKKSSPLRPYVHFRPIVLDDLCKATGGAKISLGFLRKENRDEYTQRTFEIPACGGLLLAERTARHAAFYREGIEAEFFDPNSPAELCDKVRGLLKDDARRMGIRDAGRKAVARSGQTYDDRARQILKLFPIQNH